MNKNRCNHCGCLVGKLEHTCKPAWNKGLTKDDPRVRKYSKSCSNTKKIMYKEGKLVPWSKGLTKETDGRLKRFSDSLKGKPKSEEFRHKLSESKKGKPNSSSTKFTSERIKEQWKNPEFRANKIKQTKKMWLNPEFRKKFKEAKLTYFKLHYKEIGQKISNQLRGKPKPMFIGDNNPSKRKDVREKISSIKKGVNPWIYFKNPEEVKRKKSLSFKGESNPSKRQDVREKLSIMFKGRKLTEEWKDKIKQKRRYQVIPNKDTSIEIQLQEALKQKGIAFEPHKPLFGQPDIFIQPNLCIFADGDYWHNREKSKSRDILVNSTLTQQGYIVLRFWEHQINSDIKSILNIIIDNLKVTKCYKME